MIKKLLILASLLVPTALMADTGDINLSSNFQENSGRPLDSRIVTASSTTRAAMTSNQVYNGMMVFQKDNSHTYQLQGSTFNWVDLGVLSSGASIVLPSSGVAFGGPGNTVVSDTNSFTWNKSGQSLAITNTQAAGFFSPDPVNLDLIRTTGDLGCLKFSDFSGGLTSPALCRQNTSLYWGYLTNATGGMAPFIQFDTNGSYPLGSTVTIKVPLDANTVTLTGSGVGITISTSVTINGALNLTGFSGNASISESGVLGQIVLSTNVPTAGQGAVWQSSFTLGPGSVGGTPSGPAWSVQVSSGATLGGFANLTNNGSNIAMTGVSSMTQTNVSSVTASGVYFDNTTSTMTITYLTVGTCVGCGTGGGGGGGGSGTVSSSPQYQIPFYSVTGSSNVISSSSNFTNNGTTITVSGINQEVVANVSTITATGVNFIYTASTMTISSATVTNINISTATHIGVVFSTLGTTAPNGTLLYCSDCTTTTPATCTANLLSSCVCAGSGSGAFAKRLNATWYCQ